MKNTSKGYTLLFAVIVSVLVLSIASFILSVSRKQAILASAARDSIYAFYAADSGLECAIEHLDTLSSSTVAGTNIQCGSNNITFNRVGNDKVGTSSFAMLAGNGTTFGNVTGSQTTQSGASSCASTTVSYVTVDGNATSATTTVVTVVTRGYNIGWNSSTGDCSITGPRKVERALQYIQYQ